MRLYYDMGKQYVEELKQELSGRRLDIWRGHDDQGHPINMHADKQEMYRNLWRRQANTSPLEGVRQPARRTTSAPKKEDGCGCKAKK